MKLKEEKILSKKEMKDEIKMIGEKVTNIEDRQRINGIPEKREPRQRNKTNTNNSTKHNHPPPKKNFKLLIERTYHILQNIKSE